MSLPDGSARERLEGRWTDDGWQDDSWADAPVETDDPAYDDLLDTRSRSLATPTYDLGPTTDTFVIDLNAAPPVASSPPAAPRHAAPPTVEPAAPEVAAPEAAGAEAAGAESAGSEAADPVAAAETSITETPITEAPTEDRRRDDLRRQLLQVPITARQGGAESLTAAKVLRTRRARPQSGWRKGVYSLTGGKINFGLSPKDRRRARLVERARTPVTGCHRLAVISLKGGVGKTTTTAALGAMFADLRGDRVIAVDANPDRGTLGERVPRESGATVRHLLAERDQLHRYSDVRSFTSQDRTRLEVLASDSDPHVSAAFSERDYRDTVAILERFYNLVLTDCGTGLLHDAMRGILGLASSLVVVSSASLDGARSASATLDWLEAHGFDGLARNAVVVISSVRPGGGIVDLKELEEHFSARCREVVTIPYDRHLEAGGVLELDELEPKTRDAYRQLAAAVGEAFSSTE
jgi:MinD-like ATPase involved in chromosome partitioning or flagellar assembly